MRSYAGIGARNTPAEILQFFEEIGELLAQKGFKLRSGKALGADSSFEKGCDKVKGDKEIFLPWKGFENSTSQLYQISKEAYELAARFHPYWDNLSQGAKKLQARNGYQVIGYDLKTPSKFVICYTEEGKGGGGTGQAIRIAKAYNIPVFDFGIAGMKELFMQYINEIMMKEGI